VDFHLFTYAYEYWLDSHKVRVIASLHSYKLVGAALGRPPRCNGGVALSPTLQGAPWRRGAAVFLKGEFREEQFMSATSVNRQSLGGASGRVALAEAASVTPTRSAAVDERRAVLQEKEAGQPQPRRNLLAGDTMVYIVLAVLTWVVWRISRLGLFEPGDDVGYWIAVVGGVMMLLLFSYPIRKRLRFTHRWGKVKWWFLVHMVLGVGGPLLILLHSNFHARSLNAAAALYSMLIVALSGVVGRFIYARVNRGLHGEQTNLRELRERAGLHQQEARSRLTFAPAVEARLKAFEKHVTTARPGMLGCFVRVFWLPVQQWLTYRACVAELREPIKAMGRLARLDKAAQDKRERVARKLVRRYLNAVVRVSQYTAYEHLFSLWHVAHLPFVYLLVISAIVHVVAVHVY